MEIIDPGESLLHEDAEFLRRYPAGTGTKRHQQIHFCAFRQFTDGLDDISHIIFANLPSGNGRYGTTYPGEKKAEIIVDLRHGADRGTGCPGDDLLLDGNGRTQPMYMIHIGFIHPHQELSCIGAEAFSIPSLPFCV